MSHGGISKMERYFQGQELYSAAFLLFQAENKMVHSGCYLTVEMSRPPVNVTHEYIS